MNLFLSRNHVRKFLRAFPIKWHPKVTAIEESKDLSTLLLDELIGKLKVYEVVLEKDSEASKTKEEKKGKVYRKCFECGDQIYFISDCLKHSYNDQKAYVGGSWSDSDKDDDSNKDEICLMAYDSNKVLSDTSYYSSSLDDESLQNEYNKLCKISLRIINKNKHLTTKNEILDNKVYELKERLKRLEKNKEINEECKSCINLRMEIDSLSLKLAKFENSSPFLQEIIENQRLHKDNKGPGFTEHKALTSIAKTGKWPKISKILLWTRLSRYPLKGNRLVLAKGTRQLYQLGKL
ncbi:hypothetical protein Tco_1500266 [Tanacetum coccineum]